MNKICIGALNQRRVGALPRSVTPCCAAFTLAMNIPTRSAMRQMPASLREAGSNSPAAPRSSKTPMMYTISRGRGKDDGIICARSLFHLVEMSRCGEDEHHD
jgi:hypothetical protein